MSGINASITVGELREYLDDLVEAEGEEVLDKKIFAVSDYGDHCHTQQLISLDMPTITTATRTAYSDSGWAVENDDDGDNEETSVVILNDNGW